MSELNGFTKIEFLVIVLSIAYGFCIVEILSNWARIIRRGVMYWETMLWSAILFIAISVLWYNGWNNIQIIERNSGNFIATLIPPIGLFVMVSALFPDHLDEWDLEKAFKKNRKLFFLTYALVNGSILILSNLITNPTYIFNYSRSVWFVACILMAFIDSKILRSVMAGGLIIWYLYVIILSGI